MRVAVSLTVSGPSRIPIIYVLRKQQEACSAWTVKTVYLYVAIKCACAEASTSDAEVPSGKEV